MAKLRYFARAIESQTVGMTSAVATPMRSQFVPKSVSNSVSRIAKSPTTLPKKNTVITLNVIGLPTLRQKPTNGWITYHHPIAGGRLTTSSTAMI